MPQTRSRTRFASFIIALVASAALILSLATIAMAGASDKVTICHSTGSASNPWTAIVVDNSAANFHPHLDANGNPNGGEHANDFLLPFEGDKFDCAGTTESEPQSESQPESEPEGSVGGGTGTPAGSVPDTATSLPGFGGPLATLIFGAILVASLGTLAYANVRAAKQRQ